MNHDNARHSKESPTTSDIGGSEPALNAWLQGVVDQHEHALVRYAQQFVGDAERARDVVQDTFMKLCRHERRRVELNCRHESQPSRDRLGGTHLTKWLYKVCRNRAIDVARKEKRMKSAPPSQFDERLESAANSPEATALEQERQVMLLTQIARLPNNQQEVLRLKFHGGLSYQEIAEVTGLTRTNVGFLLHTAISKLRQRVATNE